MQTAFAYLGTECCLFMEIAMHELTILPSGDLTAVDRKQLASAILLRLEPSTWARQAGQSKFPSTSLPLHLCLPHHPGAENRRQLQRSLSLRGVGAPAHLPLVPMQQGRPLILQSMCNKPVWLLWACSVQI